MSDALDLEPIKTRLAAATPGEWEWDDVIRPIPYEEGTTYVGSSEEALAPGNDGSLGIAGLYKLITINQDTWTTEGLLTADEDEEIPGDPDNPDDIDLRKWRGPIKVSNPADLTFIASAKDDIAALIAEVERLRILLSGEQPLEQPIEPPNPHHEPLRARPQRRSARRT